MNDYKRSCIVKFVNRNCRKSSCFICKEGDKYSDYRKCPYFELKQLSRTKTIENSDIPLDLLER